MGVQELLRGIRGCQKRLRLSLNVDEYKPLIPTSRFPEPLPPPTAAGDTAARWEARTSARPRSDRAAHFSAAAPLRLSVSSRTAHPPPPLPRGLHSPTSQVNLSRFGHTSPGPPD